jgi:uncharacterized membrane protein
MMEILSAFGLSAATGLNAYLPLLIVGLLARFTGWITLKAPWNILENTWVLLVLALLLVIEMVVDKIPAADTVNDVIHTFIRPAAGAILFAASSNLISEMSPVLAMICGLLAAGGIHAVKTSARPMITVSTGGLGNPVISLLEDIISGVTAFIAIVLPILTVIFFAALLFLFVWWRTHRYQKQAGRI